jgi:hypothetical protein
MEEIAYILSIIFLLAGVVGAIIPVVPGPILTYLGALILYWVTDLPFSSTDIWIMGGVTVVVLAGDYLLQVLGVKKMGGGKMAVRGTIVGTIIGIFFTPIGILIGAFLGAFLGARSETDDDGKALKIALGSMVGFLLGTALKLTFALYMIYYLIDLAY